MLLYKTIHINDFYQYENELTELYVASFSHDLNMQFISESDAKNSLRSILEKGTGIMVVDDKQPVGLTLFHPLELDTDFPAAATANSLYIAEIMVAENYRGKGIAKQMLEKVEEFALENQFKSLTLRVWDKNSVALALYKKLNFIESGIQITQIKHKKDKSPFTMRKIYLHKELK